MTMSPAPSAVRNCEPPMKTSVVVLAVPIRRALSGSFNAPTRKRPGGSTSAAPRLAAASIAACSGRRLVVLGAGHQPEVGGRGRALQFACALARTGIGRSGKPGP